MEMYWFEREWLKEEELFVIVFVLQSVLFMYEFVFYSIVYKKIKYFIFEQLVEVFKY